MNGWELMKAFMNHCQTFSEENKYEKVEKQSCIFHIKALRIIFIKAIITVEAFVQRQTDYSIE
jgi:hypothetical protein